MQTRSRPVVGSAEDRAERIADRIADGVMRSSGPPGYLEQSPAHTSPSVAGDAAPEVVRDVVRSPGQPLDTRTRAFFEPRFGYDFSPVRVHVGDRARHSARAIGARAYAIGSHIVLGEGSASPSELLAHELAHVMIECHSDPAGDRPVVRRQTGPHPPVPAAANFTAEEAALLGQARATLQPKGNAIVGVLIPQGGKPIFLQSGGGQGFSSHIEGKATTMMREQGITRAKLIVELEPCQICDRSNYPGPDVPTGGVTGSASGKQIPLQISKINTALPADTKLTVVGPESTGVYEGVGPKVSPQALAAPVSDPHPDPQPAQKSTAPKPTAPAPTPKVQSPVTTPTTTPPAVEPAPRATVAPTVEPAPKATVERPPTTTVAPSVKPATPLKVGAKAALKTLGWALLFAGLDYLAIRQMEKQVEADIDRARPHMLNWAQHEKTRTPDKPVYLVLSIRFEDCSRYMVFLGWLPDRKLHMAFIGITDKPVDPPRVEVEADHSLRIFRPGKTTLITYTELLIP